MLVVKNRNSRFCVSAWTGANKPTGKPQWACHSVRARGRGCALSKTIYIAGWCASCGFHLSGSSDQKPALLIFVPHWVSGSPAGPRGGSGNKERWAMGSGRAFCRRSCIWHAEWWVRGTIPESWDAFHNGRKRSARHSDRTCIPSCGAVSRTHSRCMFFAKKSCNLR